MPKETVEKTVPVTRKVTYTVKARNAKERGHHNANIYLVNPSGPMAPRYGWSFGCPETGFDMDPEKLLEKARGCTYPISCEPDRRTLKVIKIVHEDYHNVESKHIPISR